MSTTENAVVGDVRGEGLPKVSPRYLAGPGQDNPAMVLDALGAAGWLRLSDEVCSVRAFTADQRRCVTFHPEQAVNIGPGLYTLWRVWARADEFCPLAWEARFTADTPVEFIDAFARALAEPEGGEGVAHYLCGPGDPDEGMRPMAEAGWVLESGLRGRGYRAPDGLGGLYYLPAAPGPEEADHRAWMVYAVECRTRFAWTAEFTATTPAHLIRAFVSAMAEPTGLSRDPATLAPAHRNRHTLA